MDGTSCDASSHSLYATQDCAPKPCPPLSAPDGHTCGDGRHSTPAVTAPVVASLVAATDSSEECRRDVTADDCSDHEIDTAFKGDGFLRTHDSDDDIDANDDDEEEDHQSGHTCGDANHRVIQALHQMNGRQNLNVKTVSKEELTPASGDDSNGDSLANTRSHTTIKTTPESRPKEYRKSRPYSLSNKWGETVGIIDANGRPKRVVNLSELKNYVPLRMRYSSQFKYYFALIDQRYPQLFRSYSSGGQRWRMRYNIFVDGLFDPLKKFDSLLHIGEIMLYFDIGKDLSIPYYVNSSFYGNYTPLERNVDTSRLTRMIVRLHEILSSSLVLQLKFPADEKAFKHTDSLFYRFLVRQKEMMDELRSLDNRSKKWFPMKHRFAIETKRGIGLDTRDDFHRRPIDNRSRDHTFRSGQKRTEEKAESSANTGGASNETKSQKSDENRGKRFETRFGLRFPDISAPFRRVDESFPLREKNSNLNLGHMSVGDRNSSKSLSKKPYQRRNQSVERMDSAVGSRDTDELRDDRNRSDRSRPKTRRR